MTDLCRSCGMIAEGVLGADSYAFACDCGAAWSRPAEAPQDLEDTEP